MIETYKNGFDFVNENKEILDTNKYLAAFFYLDAQFIKEVNQKNYCLKIIQGDYCLLCFKVEPYNMMLFGEPKCVKELFEYIFKNKLEMNDILCADDVGLESIKVLKEFGYEYVELVGMDFMEAKEITNETSKEVISATIVDFETICAYSNQFIIDCGLKDEINRDKIKDTIGDYRIIKEEGIIKSMAKIAPSTQNSKKIVAVYTPKEYRGLGYGGKVVNACKNEILNSGKIATLNVDKKNPISNHLYASLGFKKVFSQGIYGKQ